MGLAMLILLAKRAGFGVIFGAVVVFLSPPLTGLFAVLGYEVRRKELLVRRPLWTTRIPLQGLRAARVDPQALRRAWKVVGNSGFFGWIGRFRSKRLGNFRALVTSPALAVMLDFGERRLVVSPDQPEAFVRALGFDPEAVETEEAGC